MDFEKTFGKTYKFYGVHDTSFKIGPHIFEAVEDEDDGYRSYLQTIRSAKDENLVFLGRSFARVRVEEYTEGEFQGYRLVDVKDGHVWLVIGTDHADDYYPCFIFNYTTPERKHAEAALTTARRELPIGWVYNKDIKKVHHSIINSINVGDYDAAEEQLKVLKKLAQKAKTRH